MLDAKKTDTCFQIVLFFTEDLFRLGFSRPRLKH